MRNYKKGETYRSNLSFPEGGGQRAYTENMYRDYTTDSDCIESFPGYRRLISLGEKIYGIYPEAEGGMEHYLVHAGGTLYRCSFTDDFLDHMTSEVLCDMAHHKSSAFCHGDSVYIFDSEDITVVRQGGSARKVSENDQLIYTPTTFKNGVEYEQVNLLTPRFYEDFRIESVEDIAYGSAGLVYRITSESRGECAVYSSLSTISGRVDIPGRKLIDGRWYKVTEILPGAFRRRMGITSIAVGPYVEKIGDEAFYDCNALEWVMLGEATREIGRSALAKCEVMTKIYLGLNVEVIGEEAFYGCEKLTSVYYFGTSAALGSVTGMEQIVEKTVYFKCNFVNNMAAIPVCTPTDNIESVTLGGASVTYNTDLARGYIIIPYKLKSDIEGMEVRITGYADTAVHIISKRGTPYANAYDGMALSDEAVYGASRVCDFDGRHHLFGSQLVPHLIFSSSYTKEGVIHPLYFGHLDYTALGSADTYLASLTPLGNRLAAVKRGENNRGKIYILRPDGEEGALFGRRLSVKHSYGDADIYSDGEGFEGTLIYLSSRGIMRLDSKSDISPATIENLSEDYTSKLRPHTLTEPLISELSGNLAVFGKGELFLGDPRQVYRSDGGHTQLRWYRITDVSAHPGESPVYYYANEAPEGYYIHPDEGKPTDGTVISYADEDGVMRYYVQIGIRRYAVVPGSELFGGEKSLPTALCKKEMSLIFGTESGELFAFNTDKRGVPPRELYESEDFDPDEYESHFGSVIHPYHYSAAGHRIHYKIETKRYDGGIPFLEKSTRRGSLTVGLERRSDAMIKVLSVADGDRVSEATVFPLGQLDFSDMDFEKIALTAQGRETHALPENQRNWVDLQIIIYTDGYLAPFAISSLSYAFRTKGRIKNR